MLQTLSDITDTTQFERNKQEEDAREEYRKKLVTKLETLLENHDVNICSPEESLQIGGILKINNTLSEIGLETTDDFKKKYDLNTMRNSIQEMVTYLKNASSDIIRL